MTDGTGLLSRWTWMNFPERHVKILLVRKSPFSIRHGRTIFVFGWSLKGGRDFLADRNSKRYAIGSSAFCFIVAPKRCCCTLWENSPALCPLQTLAEIRPFFRPIDVWVRPRSRLFVLQKSRYLVQTRCWLSFNNTLHNRCAQCRHGVRISVF